MSLKRATCLMLSLCGLTVLHARGDDGILGGGSEARARSHPLSGFSEGMGRISINDKWGFINEQGRVIIAPRFDYVQSFSEGMAPVMIGHKWGFINPAGKVVIPPVSDSTPEFSEGVACVSVDRAFQYLDKTGKVAIPSKFEWARNFSEGWASVVLSGRQHYIDHRGHIVLTPDVARSGDFHEGLAVCWDQPRGTFGFIDRKGRQVIPARFQRRDKWRPPDFHQGRALVPDGDDKWGYIDSMGVMEIPARYRFGSAFSEGLAGVATGVGSSVRIGFIDLQGQHVIDPRFERAGAFSEGLAWVWSEDEAGYIDRSGKLKIRMSPDKTLYDFDGRFAMVMMPDLKWGYIDRSGKWIWRPTK
jgi:hypothetical protein